MTLGEHKTHHVGLEKYKVSQHDFTHFSVGPGYGSIKGGRGSKNDPMRISFKLQEPEKLNPSFNVLYVRTQRPSILQLPLVRLFLDTWAEMVELVRPAFRFGIPASSFRDKCRYWREDGSSLPITPNMQTQRLLKAISNEGFGASWHGAAHHGAAAGGGAHGAQAEFAKAASAAAGHGHGHGGGQGHGHRRHLSPLHQQEEFAEAVTPWVVLGLNVAAWCYLGTSANKPPPGM